MTIKTATALLLLVIWTCVSATQAQSDPTAREWNKPTDPFRIIGEVYYVGSEGISVFLITSDKGHILIDGGFEETAPQVIANIKKLGFDIGDVKLILNSHSHYDHAGGIAELKRRSGAKLLASGLEAKMLGQGGRNDPQFGDELPYESVAVDRIIRNGEKIRLGDKVITALATPGHTQGATSFAMTARENGETYSVVFASSISAPGYKLKNNTKYPGIAKDFRYSFQKLEKLPCDAFLTFHTDFFNMAAKRKAVGAGKPNPFIDRAGLRSYVVQLRTQFEKQMAEEK